ncbi:hypothetical protein [Aestuariivirga sp.]|uniref:hypothetical protein n=1 Tax=Aestuariivirga sp. TaxID=2650926 RepID=UPI00391D5932
MSFLQAALLLRLERRRKLAAYRRARAEAEAMSDSDLADMGLRRYQLGHVARLRALRG